MSQTFLDLVREMADVLADEGLTQNRDKAVLRLVELGYRPRHVAVFLDLVIALAQRQVAVSKTSQGIDPGTFGH
jgi:hypothetical protein